MLTAFNVQSYQLLQPDPSEPMLATLQQISVQLSSFTVNPSFINSTQPTRSPDQLQLPFRASPSVVWINVLWFASLICSLASASIALIVKQWLFEESKGLSGTSREAARLRQYRLNSLIEWNVGTMILVPSVLLQIALFLFLSGLLVLLWTIHETVAAVMTTLVGALFVFVYVITVLPVFASDCCYRSPQAYGTFVMARLVWNMVGRFAEALLRQCAAVLSGVRVPTTRPDRGPMVVRLDRLLLSWYSYCGRWKMRQLSTWNGAEQTEVARDNGVLDRHIATMAYTTTFATEHLEALHVLLSDLPCDQAFSCFSDIHRSWTHLWGPNDDVERSGKLTRILLGKPFYCALRKALAIIPDERNRALGRGWAEVSSKHLLSSYHADQYLPHRSPDTLSTLAHLSMGDSVFAKKTFRLLYSHLGSGSTPPVVPYNILRDGESLPPP